MIITKGVLPLLIFWICACSKAKQVENPSIETLKKEGSNEFKQVEKHTLTESMEKVNRNESIGKSITLIGKTANARLGAILVLENEEIIYMDDMESWPSGYYNQIGNEEICKTIKVTGILIEQYDLPVFIPDENNLITPWGIPVPKGTDLKKASHRYLLRNYKWDEVK